MVRLDQASSEKMKCCGMPGRRLPDATAVLPGELVKAWLKRASIQLAASCALTLAPSSVLAANSTPRRRVPGAFLKAVRPAALDAVTISSVESIW